MSEESEDIITVDQLQPGIYILLPNKWFDHPFFFNKFKIRTQAQIKKLKEYGIKSVRFDPDKSDCEPLSLATKVVQQEAPLTEEERVAQEEAAREAQLEKERQERIERLKKRREDMNSCEKHYQEEVKKVKNVMKSIYSEPAQAIQDAVEIIDKTVDDLLDNSEVVVNVINDKSMEENTYFHCMNVSVLALLIGKEYALEKEDMRALGMGALFHDVGKNKIPTTITLKKEPLLPAERKFLHFHPQYGADIVTKVEHFPPAAVDIVWQHHEKNNGKGYPRGLKDNQINILAKITAIANNYDNLCNHLDRNKSLTPFESLSFMYNYQKQELDPQLLTIFIHRLGVYPPGTLVQLSDGTYGVVVSINPNDLLHPHIILYDPDIPKEEAIIWDTAEEKDVKIEKSVRPGNLPEEVCIYLSPKSNLQYSYSTPTKNVS